MELKDFDELRHKCPWVDYMKERRPIWICLALYQHIGTQACSEKNCAIDYWIAVSGEPIIKKLNEDLKEDKKITEEECCWKYVNKFFYDRSYNSFKRVYYKFCPHCGKKLKHRKYFLKDFRNN